MNQSNHHIIQRQILDLHLPSEKKAFAQQKAFQDFFEIKLLPKLSSYFDEIAPPDTVVRLDRLEIDLGYVEQKELDELDEKRLVEKLRTAIFQQIKKPESAEATVEFKKVEKDFELLLFVLKNGTLPWWQNRDEKIDLPTLLESILEQLTAPQINILKNEIRQAIIIFYKLAEKEKSLELVFDHFLKMPEAYFFQRLVFGFSDTLLLRFYEKLFPEIKTGIGAKKINPILAYAKNEITGQPEKQMFFWLDKLNETVFKKEQPLSVKKQLVENHEQIEEEKEPRQTAKKDKKEEIYFIENSGLVLVAPYLPQFFKKIGLVENNDFINTAAKNKAMAALHYLAGYGDELPEYTMLLNKILCGHDIEKPVWGLAGLNKKEKTSADGLLEAVIENWGALKNTSPQGLQEAFLQRKGKLVFNKFTNDWQLQVEHKAYDLLLGKLPWTYSMIKLPWMEGMLKVEWQ